MRQVLNSFLLLLLISSYAFAQEEVGSFSERNLPDSLPQQGTLPKVSVDEAPINQLKINKSKTIGSELKESLSSILLNNKVSSLMFDDEQNTNIEQAIDAFKNNQQYVPKTTDEPKQKTDLEKAKEDAAREREEEEAIAENEKSFVYLASIIYFTTNNWVVWVNEQKITSATNDPEKEIYLTSVTSDSVKIVWKISLSKWKILSGQKSDALAPNLNEDNQVVLEFQFKPNQTYALSTNRILEGRVVVALLKKKESSSTQSTQNNE